MEIVFKLNSIEEIGELQTLLEGFTTRKQKSVPIGELPIQYLELDVRTRNCLLAERIETIGQLITWSETMLLRTPNLGRKSRDEIIAALAGKGLSLASSQYATCKVSTPPGQ